ncbi:MAG: monophosphatase [Streptosporangiaceae bacterium]|nr:inositol monophosphatase [Streptosporangiaceae bacterium]MDX6434746.1 monophosphatase [Streptosporangiaceae bacterium]
MTSAPIDLARAERVAIEAAEAAGTLLRGGEREPAGIRPKGSAGDVVTDLDVAAEKLILERLQSVYPDHQIIAEESGVLGAEDACVWLVDPLDGTNNVAIGLPVYSVGIALCHDKIPVLGVVHSPVTGQTWSATRHGGTRGPGGGALRPAVRPPGPRPVLAWTQGHGVGSGDRSARALKLLLEARALRLLQLWAPLLAWVMLARGHIDGIVGYRAEMVDLPAGALLAVEAGLAVHALDGSPFDHRIDLPDRDRSFVAGRPELIGGLLEMVAAAERMEPGLTRAVGPVTAP